MRSKDDSGEAKAVVDAKQQKKTGVIAELGHWALGKAECPEALVVFVGGFSW